MAASILSQTQYIVVDCTISPSDEMLLIFLAFFGIRSPTLRLYNLSDLILNIVVYRMSIGNNMICSSIQSHDLEWNVTNGRCRNILLI